MPTSEDLTRLLSSWQAGDEKALDVLLPLVYDELRAIARAQLRREGPGHTLEATSLVNEAYLRIAGLNDMSWTDRRHFFAMSSRVMRRLLIDHARERAAQKRGGRRHSVTLEEVAVVVDGPNTELLALDEALTELEQRDPRAAKVVEMRFFVGLGVEEIAEALGLSIRSIKRDWALAKAFLHRQLKAGATAV